MGSPSTLVIIPTYNEVENIENLITLIEFADSSLDILVVDDASPDGTAEVVEEMNKPSIFVLRRPGKSGLGAAYIAGYQWALSRNYQLIAQMDADGSHRPKDLIKLIQVIRSDSKIGLVVGSRWIPNGTIVGWSKHREILSRVANRYSRYTLNSEISDLTSGFRVFRSSILKKIDLSKIASQGYSFQIEMALKVEQSDTQVFEFPITFVERANGRSKMTLGIVLEAMKLVSLWGIKGRRK